MTKGRLKRSILLAGSLLLLVFFVFKTSRRSSAGKATVMHDSITVVPFQTAGGWGYSVNVGTHAYIYQDFIPAIPGRSVFRSREDALRVGARVADKLRKKQLPTITVNELVELGIIN